ncbi:DUF2934 domain-containing protein [Polyangium spumosum]|nr:DUF2934 domain-containing protein [Polyangium spumosum]
MKTKGKKAAKKGEIGKKGAKAAASAAVAVAVAETLPPPPVALAPAPAPTPEAPATIDEDSRAPAASERRPISMEERRRLIALAAYRRAETIGFGKTNPLEDWLVAEREIDAMLAGEIAT